MEVKHTRATSTWGTHKYVDGGHQQEVQKRVLSWKKREDRNRLPVWYARPASRSKFFGIRLSLRQYKSNTSHPARAFATEYQTPASQPFARNTSSKPFKEAASLTGQRLEQPIGFCCSLFCTRWGSKPTHRLRVDGLCLPEPDMELADVRLQGDLAAPGEQGHAPVPQRGVHITEHNVHPGVRTKRQSAI